MYSCDQICSLAGRVGHTDNKTAGLLDLPRRESRCITASVFWGFFYSTRYELGYDSPPSVVFIHGTDSQG
jgi:hypothetical protein